MKRWIPWIAVAIVVAVVAAGALRAIAARKAQQQTASSARAERVVMDIAPGEVIALRARSLTQGIPISGAVRAVQSATIKARVAGELQGLSLREGDRVQAGQVVARIDTTETQARVRQAQQQADAARAQVAISQRQFDNNQALVAQGFISKTALDTSRASLDAAKASYQAAVAGADVARKSLADTVLKSPIDGMVAQRLVQNGERVAVEARILEVVDLSNLEVEALVPAAEATQVRVGQTATLALEGTQQSLQARVVRISPSAQAGSRAVPVYLAIANMGALPGLRQGVFVQGTIAAGTVQALAVPLDAVRTDQADPYVQVAEGSQVAHRAVQTGKRVQIDGATWVAVQGVPEGSKVLTARVGALPVGTALKLPADTPAALAAPAAPAASAPVPTASAAH
ncbi:MAG: efflux RND transporter periplasmic adaptor subunit [Giesbergeria sp.]|nr:efflux RND transporter periplasmic adaptor subunit [Giesbergeria sp.]MBP6160574.1 efflux RND transporter periplasmic adaptor subunit [Giesbergeria sp.]MBP7084022.1 efflux RND transporter periplasmic adaptor subunit [Giesbergeria sp.]MBP9783525.1 efflux RND transporter periplasmic adaptor subunit [Giesbergeria sp.]MBP9894889.1 efflux RND transporter periplasmic adaptor subunit [Giesbergeria sp.]